MSAPASKPAPFPAQDEPGECGVCGEDGADVRDTDSKTGLICWPCLEAESDQEADDFHSDGFDPSEGY